LLSNTSPIHIQKLQEFAAHGYPIRECFEKLYLSYEIGLSKPDKAIFDYVLKDAGLKPEETLLIDDGPENCRVAAELGIRTYQPKPLEDFTDMLLRPDACVATMGFFDGVHKGHQFLIRETIRLARERQLPSMVICMWPHPRTVLHADFYPQLLTDREERYRLLKETGVDYVFTLPFDREMAGLSAFDFMSTVLKDELHVHTLVMGFNHRFGNDGTADFMTYQSYGKTLGIEVIQATPYWFSAVWSKFESLEAWKKLTRALLTKPIDPVVSAALRNPDKTPISSSLIRRFLLTGLMEPANMALGYGYSIAGVVVGGHQIGHQLGFPTANIEPLEPAKLVPALGVYAVWVEVAGNRYKGMMNIGKRPTIHQTSNVVMEVHLLHFDGNLYGKKVNVYFVQRFRTEELFPDVESLVRQIHQDGEYVEWLLDQPSYRMEV
jgi:cytidyltransferase-like protein